MINSIYTIKKDYFLRHFFTFGSNKLNGYFYDRLRMGLSVEQDINNKFSAYETYLTFYYPFGSFIWFRRLSYIFGAGNSFNRKIVSADLALLVLDFQINYGQFREHEKDWQLVMNFPLIGNASGSFFLGIGYNRFLSKISSQVNKDNFKFYLFFGPNYKLHNSRLQLTLQYDTNGIYKHKNGIWSTGISINFNEK